MLNFIKKTVKMRSKVFKPDTLKELVVVLVEHRRTLTLELDPLLLLPLCSSIGFAVIDARVVIGRIHGRLDRVGRISGIERRRIADDRWRLSSRLGVEIVS